MIREKGDELGTATLNLRCIRVLSGYTTNTATVPTFVVSFLFLASWGASAALHRVNYLFLQIFYSLDLRLFWFFSSTYDFSSTSLITFSDHPNISVLQESPSTQYSTSSTCSAVGLLKSKSFLHRFSKMNI